MFISQLFENKLNENAEELNIGDPVIIVGDVQFKGSTGEIAEFGKDKRFVIVNLYNHGRHSFHSSDVEYNDYADSDDEEMRIYDTDADARAWNLDEEGDEAVAEPQVDLPPPENAQKTQIAGTLPTYKKGKAHLDTHQPTGKTLDFGAGLGGGAAEMGADSYEPFPREGFKPTYTKSNEIPSNSYHRVTNFNVLNVVPQNIRNTIVSEIGRILAPGGIAIITTRGKDVMSAKGADGPEPMSRLTTIGTYQKGFTTKELMGYVQQVLGQGFDVKPIKLGPAGVLVRKNAEQGVAEAEGDCEGLPHLTKELLSHIVQQIGTEGAHAIVKSLEWGDGAAEELLSLIKHDLENDIGIEESVKQRLDKSCWSGYHKEGTKIKGGTRVNNCVANESRFNSKQEVIDHFVRQGKSAAAGASAWERGWRGTTKVAPKKTGPVRSYHDDLDDKRYKDMDEGYSHGFADPNAPKLGRNDSFRNQERNAGLEHETNNIAIAINGKTWKVVPGKGYADSFEERSYLQGMKRWAEKKSASSGKTWTVHLTGAPVSKITQGSNLVETFDQPYPIQWEHSEYEAHDALAKLEDGTNLSIHFNLESGGPEGMDEEWHVEFWRNKSLAVTGEGDAQRIFATVLVAIQEFIKTENPERVAFSASKEVEPGQNSLSRSKLYNRLVQRYASAWGYNVRYIDQGNQVNYELIRKKRV